MRVDYSELWELDRVLHATSVYANLLPFRKRMLKEITDPIFKEFYEEASKSGEKSFNHLIKSIYEKRNFFDKDGIKIIESINNYYNHEV